MNIDLILIATYCVGLWGNIVDKMDSFRSTGTLSLIVCLLSFSFMMELQCQDHLLKKDAKNYSLLSRRK